MGKFTKGRRVQPAYYDNGDFVCGTNSLKALGKAPQRGGGPAVSVEGIEVVNSERG